MSFHINEILKILVHTPVVQTLDSTIHWAKSFQRQPSKFKFFLGHHLATKSFGLGRLFYKSSCQLQNFRHNFGFPNTYRLDSDHSGQ